MFKINKVLWITTLAYCLLELILLLILILAFPNSDASVYIFSGMIAAPLIGIIVLWINGKVRKGKVKTNKVRGLSERDKALIRHYSGKDNIEKISYKELGDIWVTNSVAYYIACSIAVFIGFVFVMILAFV